MSSNFAVMLRSMLRAAFVSAMIYFGFLGLLTVPALQSQVIYLNRVDLTWFQDVNVPEQWGFLYNQVTPFTLPTPDGERLHAWHILPIEVYRRHEQQLKAEPVGLATDITQRLGFSILKNDPESLLVVYLHGAAGTLGSGWRPPSYRAMHANAPSRIHTVAIDYRGFGRSTGTPSEQGLLIDARTLVKWATEEAGIPSSRIVIFAQSLRTAVAISGAHDLALAPQPIYFRGIVLVAPFVDVERLTASYRIAGTIPLLSPIARFSPLLAFFNTLIWTKWPSKSRLSEFIRHCEKTDDQEARYHVTMIHAKDDYDIPWTHTQQLYWYAVNATTEQGISYDDLELEVEQRKEPLGAGGWAMHKETVKGVLREEIAEHGLHDRIMSYPIVSLVIWRAFQIGTDI